MSSLGIVIVNYCSAIDVIACLESLEPVDTGRAGAHVYVVDNRSPDGSGEKIKNAIDTRGWSAWATFIAAPRNGGFSYGNNLGLAAAMASSPRPQLYFLLNPDTTVQPNAVNILVKFMNDNPKVGICGARLEWKDGTSQWAARRFPTLASEMADALHSTLKGVLTPFMIASPDRETCHATDWIVGAAMMIREKVIDEIGLLDEAYFLYFEEVDYCLRAKRAGWPCWYVPESRIFHTIGRSTGVGIGEGSRLPRYWFESRGRYFDKSFGKAKRFLIDLLWTLIYPVGRFISRLSGKSRNDPRRLWRDFVFYNFFGSYRP